MDLLPIILGTAGGVLVLALIAVIIGKTYFIACLIGKTSFVAFLINKASFIASSRCMIVFPIKHLLEYCQTKRKIYQFP